MLAYSVKNFQGHSRKPPKRDDLGSSRSWMHSSHSGTSMDTSPLHIYIGPALFGLVTIYLVTQHHLGGYLCFSQERNSDWLPTNTPIWIILHSIRVSLRKELRCTVWLYLWNQLDSIKRINQILAVSHVLIKKKRARYIKAFFSGRYSDHFLNVSAYLGIRNSLAVMRSFSSHMW